MDFKDVGRLVVEPCSPTRSFDGVAYLLAPVPLHLGARNFEPAMRVAEAFDGFNGVLVLPDAGVFARLVLPGVATLRALVRPGVFALEGVLLLARGGTVERLGVRAPPAVRGRVTGVFLVVFRGVARLGVFVRPGVAFLALAATGCLFSSRLDFVAWLGVTRCGVRDAGVLRRAGVVVDELAALFATPAALWAV